MDNRPGTAPEDSSQWKCNWLMCEHGIGLAGDGICSTRGYWNIPNCPLFEQARCQHNIPLTEKCPKCQELNIKIGVSP